MSLAAGPNANKGGTTIRLGSMLSRIPTSAGGAGGGGGSGSVHPAAAAAGAALTTMGSSLLNYAARGASEATSASARQARAMEAALGLGPLVVGRYG